MSVSLVLLKIRNKLKLTQMALAAELGVTRTAISYWANGLRSPKDQHKLKIISYAKKHNIKVKLEDFLHESLL